MNIKENYQQYVSRYASEVAALKRKNTGFITGSNLLRWQHLLPTITQQ